MHYLKNFLLENPKDVSDDDDQKNQQVNKKGDVRNQFAREADSLHGF